MASRGSSPRGRGKPHTSALAAPHGGLIPARAGKTHSMPPWPLTRSAHPRAGGENHTIPIPTPTYNGSSPRGRGKPCRLTLAHTHAGLIPARAGKTVVKLRPAPSAAAHPRAGGENHLAKTPALVLWGSSPRGRGKLHHPNQELYDARLIPARAGKTDQGEGAASTTEAHPRAGGENLSSGQTTSRP